VVVVGKYLMNMIRFSLVALALEFGLSSCAREGAPIQEAQYAATIVGDWIGTVGDTKETISFGADGKFVSKVRPGGFINNTLSQGVTARFMERGRSIARSLPSILATRKMLRF
jgi:hypothetical protein